MTHISLPLQHDLQALDAMSGISVSAEDLD